MPVTQEFMNHLLTLEPIKGQQEVIDSLQRHLEDALQRGVPERVKDYLLAARILWQDFEDCPLDTDILKEAVRFLRNRGWVVNLQFDDPNKMFRSPEQCRAVILSPSNPEERWTQ